MLFYLISCQYEPSSPSAHRLLLLEILCISHVYILLPLMFISASLILYFFPFGVKIMKFDFLVFNESLFVLNQVENLCS